MMILVVLLWYISITVQLPFVTADVILIRILTKFII